MARPLSAAQNMSAFRPGCLFVLEAEHRVTYTLTVKGAEVTDSTQQTLILLFFPCLLDSDLIIIELMESQCKEELVLHIVVVGFHHKKGCQVRDCPHVCF